MNEMHKLNDEWLMAYGAGAMNEGEALFIQTYLSLNPAEIKDAFLLVSEIGGAFLSSVEPEDVADTTEMTVRFPQDLSQNSQDCTDIKQQFPVPLQNILNAKECENDNIPWTFLGPGLKKIHLWTGKAGEQLWLLRGEPGARVPDHSHEGVELTMVLQGSFSDRFGQFCVGDVEEADSDISHNLRIDDAMPCICLVYMEKSVVMKSWLAGLLQKVAGL